MCLSSYIFFFFLLTGCLSLLYPWSYLLCSFDPNEAHAVMNTQFPSRNQNSILSSCPTGTQHASLCSRQIADFHHFCPDRKKHPACITRCTTLFALKEKHFVYVCPCAVVCFLLVMALLRQSSWCV